MLERGLIGSAGERMATISFSVMRFTLLQLKARLRRRLDHHKCSALGSHHPPQHSPLPSSSCGCLAARDAGRQEATSHPVFWQGHEDRCTRDGWHFSRLEAVMQEGQTKDGEVVTGREGRRERKAVEAVRRKIQSSLTPNLMLPPWQHALRCVFISEGKLVREEMGQRVGG
ncbi:hypothetical protein C0Q70_20686 [Pomacea canaliculata]|uniref:Uncharacterized protein n=1 Tax=Pomacea canaliculata TaxID=400727 RepID=A0A2T7NGA4_POMCA|nr:hypothetical protein C0Q70_20686 [Pomacea canaliculata]